MINRNVADYTNFDGKTNKRIVQAPGGASSLSLGWGHQNTDYNNNKPQNQRNNAYEQQKNDNYGQKHSNNMNRGYDSYEEPMGVMGHNYEKGISSKNNVYDEQNFKHQSSKQNSNNTPIGGQHGYNNYNLISHQQNSYQNYPPSNKYPLKQVRNQPKAPYYSEKNDPTSFYKPSSNYAQIEYDTALEQQKHKIQSSRSKRSQNTPNSVHQQSTNESKPCVKIHQQKNNDIFGSHYDYWKQDGHSKNSGQNTKKEAQFMYEKNQQFRPKDNEIFGGEKNEKTSVKVHNPPGGKTNFIFG